MLGQLLDRHHATVWLVNTGWTGGPAGVGSRMKLGHTRAMVQALLRGELAHAPTETDPVFGLHVPTTIPGVPAGVLRPRDTWADQTAYDAQAAKLARMFRENFAQFAAAVGDQVAGAGPR